MMWCYIKYIIVANLGGFFAILCLAIPSFGDFFIGCSALVMTATLICEDWIEAFEKWVANLCGYNTPSPEDRIAKAIDVLQDTYGMDCADADNIERAIDILNGGYYPPSEGR